MNKSCKLHSKALGVEIEVGRVIGRLKGSRPGPTVVFFGGIHGNEPSGVFALKQVIEELKGKEDLFHGEFIALSGNLWAMAHGKRFHEHDLNRMWTAKRMAQIESGNYLPDPEGIDEKEQMEIYEFLNDLLENTDPPFYFLDLHTTSSDSIPFLTVNDTLSNRGFATKFPVPIILGIEEYLDGPLLSYINELGYIALGFEAGQHDAEISIINHRAFIYLTLAHSGFLSRKDMPDYRDHCSQLTDSARGSRAIYEIRYRYEVVDNEKFHMFPGYLNFQHIAKGDDLAKSNGSLIESHQDGMIFMPLYQNQGDDGFFLIRRIPRLALRISAWLRKRKLNRFLVLLPGVSKHPNQENALIVDKRVARFYARDFFHLFGYRSKQLDEDHIVMRDRETASRYWEYKASKN